MLELPEVEIRVQFAVDPFQEIEVKSFCDPRLIVVCSKYDIGAFF